jgi:hypothetical protein
MSQGIHRRQPEGFIDSEHPEEARGRGGAKVGEAPFRSKLPGRCESRRSKTPRRITPLHEFFASCNAPDRRGPSV